MNRPKKMDELRNRLLEIYDLGGAANLLSWDQMTYMPAGGAEARGRQMSTLRRLEQEKKTDAQIGRLLDDLRPYEESLPYEHDDSSLIRVTRRDYERALKIPPDFTVRMELQSSESYQVWSQARPANDFARVRPYLEKNLDLSRELANFFPGYEHIADPLIDFQDPGMTAASVRSLFTELRARQVPIVQAVLDGPPADDSCLRQHFPDAAQMEFCGQLVAEMGYDYSRGRIDKTHHPFTTSFSIGDVRITTRVREDFLGECLFSDIHEAGHAMYEQGVDASFDGLPLGEGASAGVHESQSRLWENVVGRSLPFWEHYYPKLQTAFPQQLSRVPLDAFHRAVNKVERSLIRTDADEVTYNLHVMLRFDLELALLEGSLEVKDLPEEWRARMQQDLGIAPENDREGVLQDVHWYGMHVGGAFQGYTIGNVLGAQFYAAALQAHPEIPDRIRQGDCSLLLNWLIANIYRHGRKFTAPELVRRITGGPISIEPYIDYLGSKYFRLYGLA